MPEKLSDLEYNLVREMLEAGVARRIVKEETGHSLGTIERVRQECGINIAAARDPLEGIDIDAILYDYRGGMRVWELCSKHGMSTSKFYNVLRVVGEPPRIYTSKHLEARTRAMDEAERMYREGILIRIIVEEVGYSQTTIHNELARRGVPFRVEDRHKDWSPRRWYKKPKTRPGEGAPTPTPPEEAS